MHPTPPHLLHTLQETNGAPLRYAPGRAIPTQCPHCGATTLAGWDDTSLAAWTTLDPINLTPTQEAACWLHLNIPTWEMFGQPGAFRFGRMRTAPWMKRISTPTPKGPILPTHTCKPPPGTNHIQVHQPPKHHHPENPPF